MKTAYAIDWRYRDDAPSQTTQTIVWAIDVADARRRFETDNRLEIIEQIKET